MRVAILIGLVCACIFTKQAASLEFPQTCRGPTGTVTSIEGMDTARARLTAIYTMPDAISYCYYSLGLAESKPNPKPRDVEICAEEFLRERKGNKPLSAEANCRSGIIGIPNLKSPTSDRPSKSSSCAEGGTQLEKLFRVLCPTHQDKITD